VTRSGDPEQRLTEALRVRSTGAGRVGALPPVGPPAGPPPLWVEVGLHTTGTRLALAAALAGGILIGVIFAVLSLVAPGVLPPLG
jgi:hypothetical protein